MSTSHRFRVWMLDGSFRDVYATTPESAKRTAESAQRLVGYRKEAAKARTAEDLGHVGTGVDYCPRCQAARQREPALFGRDDESARVLRFGVDIDRLLETLAVEERERTGSNLTTDDDQGED